MCSLAFGIHSSTEDMELVFDCRYYKAARKLVDYIGAQRTWPQDTATIDLWPKGTPLIFDLSHAYSVTINMCADYINYLRSHEDEEEPETVPGMDGEHKEPA